MNINTALVKEAISQISAIPNLYMDPHYLVLDLLALTSVESFDSDEKFSSVIRTLIHSFELISKYPESGESLKNDFYGYSSYHFLSDYPSNHPHDDMRIIYTTQDDQLWIIGFGHRYLPSDIYDKLRSLKRHSSY
ncbi:hypothetical protein MKY84_13585 [Chryseomicrobium sp. FSL W7-1435]|uniref:type II toxin-antitoxin system RelE family toxin n=1 Tax=Chryseomicrobium sp. FSL W7-1435 TaxID=2921704 RepID=UPI00315ACD82